MGLIPFDVQAYPALVHAVHPLKLYEYLACDLPVVATRWDELERLASPAILCDSVMDFQIAIRKALTDRQIRARVAITLARRTGEAASI